LTVDYKDTLHLPRTDFPMKADLARKEPEILRGWREQNLDARILDARRGSPLYVLHDGPPYANGHIHYGHILNKILKDLVCKYRAMAGFYTEFKPGWDCHGLPIELAVLREKGAANLTQSPLELRRACHAYAMQWVSTQREEFQRLGVFGTWDKPYLTLDPTYEAAILQQLATFAEQGLLYRARKPVHWCTSDRTALAEAEIEYDNAHVSPSIYVKFALPEPGLYAVIWTTTPWTLPANHAIAYHPGFAYVTVAAHGERYVVARDLADAFVKACNLAEEGPRVDFSTDQFASLKAARHPFMERDSVLLPAEHVTLEQGTGLVHTAPGHGADDYILGKKYGLPIDAPVDDAGKFSAGPWQGQHVFAANPAIVAHLADIGALVSPTTATVTHAYPICWRCKKPIIFRATFQWFAAMDQPLKSGATLRQTALDDIAVTTFIPPWGEKRIEGMIANRPDWVLSRQRSWGVPIPVLYDKETHEPAAADGAFMRAIAAQVAEKGSDLWFEKDADELARLGGREDLVGKVAKGQDIVDVWFESGASWAAVIAGKPGLDAGTPTDPRPADLYLEGSDQHRGWFHSSLLASAAATGHAPYRTVLTHGFVLDENGRPYSKSEIEKARKEGRKVEYIQPEDVLKVEGAERLRMWVAQADFRNDIAYSRGHLTQLGDTYRKIRNTARYLLGNLSDFDPAQHTVAAADLTDPLDRWLHGRIGTLVTTAERAYQACEFHIVLRAITDFCVVDLSALYCDVRKDRLYCDAGNSPLRRATQTLLYSALRAMTTLMAPVLCFTAEEIWGYMARLPGDPSSVHLALYQPGWPSDATLDATIGRVLELRSLVQKELEPFRAQKKSSLDAAVALAIPDAADLAQFPEGWLADVCIVSSLVVTPGETKVTVAEATGHKCARCWKWTPDAPICTRCQAAVDSTIGNKA